MSFRYEVRLSGAGGQGLILAGVIMAEAAAIYDELNATQTQSYGPEARGGASKSEVIISDGDIDYPKASNLDVLLALTQESCDKYIGDLKDDGILIVDGTFVHKIPDGKYKVFSFPITTTAIEKVGKKIVANIVALGVIQGISKIISRGAIEKALMARVPRGTEALNKKALEEGIALVRASMSESG